MTLLGPDVSERYGELCRAIRAKGRPLHFLELTTAADLALEEAKERPDPAELARLRRRLGLEEETE